MREARLHVLDESNTTASTDYNFHRCLVSEHIDVHPDRTQFVQLSKEITSRHTNVIFRNDLYDCNIEICSPEVGTPCENNAKLGPRSIHRELRLQRSSTRFFEWSLDFRLDCEEHLLLYSKIRIRREYFII